MRAFLVSCSSLLLVAGCGGAGSSLGGGDGGSPGASGDYVAGPFGYVEGATIENIAFEAKWDPAGVQGQSSYDQLTLAPLSFGDLHRDATVKYIVVQGVAGWCVPCNDEQATVPALQAKYQPRGVRFIEVMVQGYSQANSAPAAERDLDKWASAHALHVIMALDPHDAIRKFADVSAFPVNMIVRSSDMKILYLQIGAQDLDPVLAALP